jgi:hypothetical protein
MPIARRSSRGVLLFACFALLLAGCGRPAAPTLCPVAGKVTYQGRPVPTGTIVFTPNSEHGTDGELARAEIQPDGSYRLKCGEQFGTAPGTYRVTVIAVEEAPAGFAPHSLVPPKYRDPELSGLSCEVAAGRENTIHFNLQ